MNLEFYRNFLSIVECGTLSATACALHVAQSALSNQVKQLEKEYGVPLFDRGARKMQLTDAGQILYEKARNMILLEDAARKELQSYAEGAAGVLRIGMTQAYPDAQMTQLLLSFHPRCATASTRSTPMRSWTFCVAVWWRWGSYGPPGSCPPIWRRC